MFLIELPESEIFNEETQTFQIQKGIILQLEHSLVSLSKWELKWKSPQPHAVTGFMCNHVNIDTITHFF